MLQGTANKVRRVARASARGQLFSTAQRQDCTSQAGAHSRRFKQSWCRRRNGALSRRQTTPDEVDPPAKLAVTAGACSTSRAISSHLVSGTVEPLFTPTWCCRLAALHSSKKQWTLPAGSPVCLPRGAAGTAMDIGTNRDCHFPL